MRLKSVFGKVLMRGHVPAWLFLLCSLIIAVAVFARVYDMRVPFFYAMDGDWGVFGMQTWDMLHGKFRVFMYRQAYMGILPLFGDALAFMIIGPGRFAQGVVSLAYWFLYLCALYVVAGKIFSSRITGLLAVVCGTLLPDTAMNIAPEPSRGYLDNFFVGLVIFWITLRIVETRDERIRLWAALGLVGGASFWTSFFAGYFLLPSFIVLLLSKPRRFFAPHAWTALLCFFIGSAPFWHFNLTSYPPWATFNLFDPSAPWATGRDHLEMLVYKFVYICSAHAPDILSIEIVGRMVVGSTLFSFLLLALSLKRRPLGEFFALPRNAGVLLLLLGAGSVVCLNLASDRYGGTDCVRYLFPLFPFIHIAVARLMTLLFNRSRIIFLMFFVHYVFFFLYDIYVHDPRLFDKELDYKYSVYRHMLGEIEPFLTGMGGPLISTPRKWDAVTLSFDLIEKGLNFVEPLSPTRAKDGLDLDAQESQFLLEPYRRGKAMERYLSSLGFEFSAKEFGYDYLTYHEYWHPAPYWYTLFYGLSRKVPGYRPVSDAGFSIRASSQAGRAGLMTDGYINTCWADASGRHDEKWIEIDCGAPTRIDRIMMVFMPDARDGAKLHRNPFRISASLAVETSDDGRNWSRAFFTHIIRGVFHSGDRIIERPALETVPLCLEFSSPEGGARYYRIVCTDASQDFRWRVGELSFFSRTAPDAGNWADSARDIEKWILDSGARRVYAPEHIGARIMRDRPDMVCFNEYPWDGHDRRRFVKGRAMDFNERTAVVVEEGFAPEFAGMLRANGLDFSDAAFGPMRVFSVLPASGATDCFWLSLCAGRVLDIEASFSAFGEGAALKAAGKAEEAKGCFVRALRLYPYNTLAFEALSALVPDVASGYAAAIGGHVPEQAARALIGGYVTICGYTLKDNAAGAGTDARFYADFLKDSVPSASRLVLYALDEDDNVVFFDEMRPDGIGRSEFGIGAAAKISAGQRVEYGCTLPDFGGRKVALWLSLLDKNGKRLPVTSVSNLEHTGNRVKIASLGR